MSIQWLSLLIWRKPHIFQFCINWQIWLCNDDHCLFWEVTLLNFWEDTWKYFSIFIVCLTFLDKKILVLLAREALSKINMQSFQKLLIAFMCYSFNVLLKHVKKLWGQFNAVKNQKLFFGQPFKKIQKFLKFSKIAPN